ncbi:MAG TPA: GntR family transcriptional regulator [Vicinamibacterales bacterium]
MPPFSMSLRSGVPIYEQVIYAVTRAIVSGELQPGDPFPSVRALSQDLKINPNTSHKIVAALIERGLLVVRPGIGTVVSAALPATASDRRSVLDDDAERLVVEARRSGLSLQEVLASIRAHWTRSVRRAG